MLALSEKKRMMDLGRSEQSPLACPGLISYSYLTGRRVLPKEEKDKQSRAPPPTQETKFSEPQRME